MNAPQAAAAPLLTGPQLRSQWPDLAAMPPGDPRLHKLASPPCSSGGQWMLWCFDYAFYRLRGRNLGEYPHGISGDRLRQELRACHYRKEFDFKTVADGVKEYNKYRHNVNTNILLSGDVIIMGGLNGAGGHAVWINEFRTCDHLLQCGQLIRQMKPIPRNLILELEAQKINSTLVSTHLPNLRCQQSVDNMLTMCQRSLGLHFELWRSPRQPDFRPPGK